MSDISDVLTVLATLASNAVYPNGSQNPSVTGTDIIVYPGWPGSDGLNKDLAAGKTHVSVFPKAEERNTTRYPEKCVVTKAPTTTLTLTISTTAPQTVTVGGTVTAPQNVMLRISGKDYVYGVQSTDTLASIAASLAALVVVDIAGTTSSGATITIGSTAIVQAARVGGVGTVVREVRRQEHVVMITVWAGTPAIRDQVAAAIDMALAQQFFVTMPDSYAARLIYKNTLVADALQKAGLYRRDLNYTVEFATTVTEQAAAVIAPFADLGTTASSEITITI